MKIECTPEELKELVKDDMPTNKKIDICISANLELLTNQLKHDVVELLKNTKFIDEFF